MIHEARYGYIVNNGIHSCAGMSSRLFLSLLQEQKKQGVIAASAGNHALALALHGRQLNIPVVVMMPEVAPLMKVHTQ